MLNARDSQRRLNAFYAADLEKIRSAATGFPSRHRSVIDRRDRTFFQRMRPCLEAGNKKFLINT